MVVKEQQADLPVVSITPKRDLDIWEQASLSRGIIVGPGEDAPINEPSAPINPKFTVVVHKIPGWIKGLAEICQNPYVADFTHIDELTEQQKDTQVTGIGALPPNIVKESAWGEYDLFGTFEEKAKCVLFPRLSGAVFLVMVSRV